MYKICAIIPLYYPNDTILKNIAKIEKQVSFIIVNDNTPYVDNSDIFSCFAKVKYQANKKNMGLSKAFNKCLSMQDAKTSDFIIFFDQDSMVSENLIASLIDDYYKIFKHGISIGCIGPVCYEKNSKKNIHEKKKAKLLPGVYKTDAILTSSMLTTYQALSTINLWNEEIFLDLADWDLCFRFSKQNLCCCLSENVILNHRLGLSSKKIGGVFIRRGAPVRIYYQVRDGLKLLFKAYTPIKYKIRFLFNILFRPIIHFIFLDDKIARLRYFYSGIFDFFKGEQGTWELRQITQK
jgi:rhamnosyltransferase